MKKYKYIIPIFALGFPFVTFAAGMTLRDLIYVLAGYLNDALGLLMGFAVLMFVWFIIKYFIIQSDDTKRAEAAKYLMWSLIGFFVILSLWGIINILVSSFYLGDNSPQSWTDIRSLFPN